MDVLALGLAKKGIKLSESITAGIDQSSWHEEKTSTTVDLVGQTIDGREVRLTFDKPSDGADGLNGFNVYTSSGWHKGVNYYWIDGDIKTFGKEIQVGDVVIAIGRLFVIDNIATSPRGAIHYECNTEPYDLRGTNGEDGVSPTITIKKSTDTEYILTITDVNGSYDTPNLKPTIDVATKDYVDDLVSATISRLEELINQKQNKLIAGSNISISGNVISAIGVVNSDSPSEVVPPAKSNEPTFKLFSAISTDDSILQETHDTENNLIDMEENLYVKFDDGTQEPDLSIVDDDLHLNTNENINIYIDDNTGDLILETEG